MSRVQLIKVAEGESEQRLDRWFRRRFPDIGQGRIEKMCRKGEIRLNGGRVKPGTRVSPGDEIRVPPLPGPDPNIGDRGKPVRPRAEISDEDARMIRKSVIYRDDHIIALNKPAGLAVQGGSKQTRHLDGLAEALKFGRTEKPRLVHRLDKDTSGLILLARDQKTASALTRAFRDRSTRKIYWALAAGLPVPRMGSIRFGLVKAAGHGSGGEGEKMRLVQPRDIDTTPGAKPAHTDYAVLENLGGRASWLALVPVTGRTHQLRAHLAGIGHPIIGDGKYGGAGQENLGDGWGAGIGGVVSRKLHLHARSLRFRHPVTGQPITLTAPLPGHMAQTWQTFGWDEGQVPADPFEEAP